MDLNGGIAGGVLAGLVGAGVWAGISYGTDIEIGWITLCIGLVVGWGVAMGGRGVGIQAGLVAVVVAVVCILLGKYMSITMASDRELGTSLIAEKLASKVYDDRVVISLIAEQIVTEQSDIGQTIEWPSAVDTSKALGEGDYLPGIWKQAQAKWGILSSAQRQQYWLQAQGAENTRRMIHESWLQMQDTKPMWKAIWDSGTCCTSFWPSWPLSGSHS